MTIPSTSDPTPGGRTSTTPGPSHDGDALAQVDLLARDALKAMIFGRERRVQRIARYRITGILGEGGMGVVYRGHDDQLDRKVAIKLMRADLHDEAARGRLLREAQGLARLSHPNVVQVHEVGESEGSIFVAMELVEGRTLRDFIDDARARGARWQDRLQPLYEAGRGLEAAHAAGLVHRDFKPENVIVGDDGRVRVLDFGLVREVDESVRTRGSTADRAPTLSSDGGSASGRALEGTLTKVGTLLGTPAYMAPEQLDRASVGAAADQFAFCVTCFEALYGRRPFEGRSLAQLHANVLAGRISRSSETRSVPSGVRTAILRGLSVEAHARWPDMTSLLAELERRLRPRASARRAALVGGVAVIGTALAATLLPATEPAPCQIDASALVGVWDEDGRTQLRRAFVEGPLPAGRTAVGVVEARLDAWAQGWVDAQRGACEATRVQGVASEERLDQRTRCLEERLRDFGGAVEVLSEGAPEVVGRAAELVAALPELDDCEQPWRSPSPSGPMPPELAGARRDLAAGAALLLVGQLDRADSIGETAARVGVEHSDRALELEARALRARVRLRGGDVEGGASALLDLIHEAERSQLDDLVAELRTALAVAVAGSWSKPELEALLLEEAETWSERVGHRGAARAHELLRARAELLLARGDHQEALTRVAELRRLGDDDDALLDELLEARVLAVAGHREQARSRFERVRDRAGRTWGEDSWLVATTEHNLGLLALEDGDTETARAELDRAEAHYRAILGTESADVARVALLRATSRLDAGEVQQAAQQLEPLVSTFERVLGPEHAEVGEVLNSLGIARFHLGQYDASIAAYQRALEIARRARGDTSPEVGLLHSNIGESLAARGDHEAALVAYEQAARIFAVTLDPADELHALVLKGQAQSRLAQGEPQAALPMLERALALYGEGSSQRYERADIHRSLARALRETGGDPSLVTTHARRSAELFTALGMEDELESLRSLLAPAGD